MLYLFLLIVAAICGLAYAAFIMSHVPGASEERFGRLEALPADVGRWKRIDTGFAGEASKADGLWREERLLVHERDAGRLVRQVRYRSKETNEIVRVDAEETVQRRRLS
jgi:hypothetical protein